MVASQLGTAFRRNLFDILAAQRNHGSVGEARVFSSIAAKYMGVHLCMIDAAGNLHVDNRRGVSTSMFTSHTDTCHRNDGDEVNPVHCEVEPLTGHTIWRAGKGQCLGADDGAGMALMMHMLDNDVAGYYTFFRGEEKGGIGSSWLADNMPDLLRQFNRAIAFDRGGASDVITHQGGGRCCSDEFAQALATALTPDDFSIAFSPDNTGVYTDTAEFVDLIPECSNTSVFYARQHGDMEWVNVSTLEQLAAQLLTVQWETLPTKRDPKVREFAGRSMFDTPAWTSGPAYKWNDSEEPATLGQEEEDLLAEIEAAELTGVYGDLMDMIADLVHPEDTALVRRLMTRRLTENNLSDAVDWLLEGTSATDVADNLYYLTSNT